MAFVSYRKSAIDDNRNNEVRGPLTAVENEL